jgi:hypothetical protein
MKVGRFCLQVDTVLRGAMSMLVGVDRGMAKIDWSMEVGVD